MKGTLYLIPVSLGGDDPSSVIPQKVIEIATGLRYFIVEEIRSARRFLRSIDPGFPIDDSEFGVLNEHTRDSELQELLRHLENGNDAGLMSEAGLPGIADPGSSLISLAHKKGIKVRPLSGPSSVILALIASGMNGQIFTFHGYLPVKPNERSAKIREIEARSSARESQIFMETPYRNMKLLRDLLTICKDNTRLCIASAITMNEEFISTKTVGEWRVKIPEIDRLPTIFIVMSS
jgi:16S rRNA (cytidine1402-2'-O)-methyltransferase